LNEETVKIYIGATLTNVEMPRRFVSRQTDTSTLVTIDPGGPIVGRDYVHQEAARHDLGEVERLSS
jgi:hypothetical protein